MKTHIFILPLVSLLALAPYVAQAANNASNFTPARGSAEKAMGTGAPNYVMPNTGPSGLSYSASAPSTGNTSSTGTTTNTGTKTTGGATTTTGSGLMPNTGPSGLSYSASAPNGAANANANAQQFSSYVYSRWDTNQDGTISRSEWNNIDPKWQGQRTTANFRALDTNHNGVLDSAETQAYFSNNSMYMLYDTNHDGVIDSTEAQKFPK